MFVACKLPHGLNVQHNGRSIVLRGANADADIENPALNGRQRGDMNGYGLTELKGDDEAAFKDWVAKVTYADGKGGAKLTTPFAPLENGSILTFASRDEAEKETNTISDMVTTGFEGVKQDDPKNKVATDDEAMKKGK